jgi:hypothetical protein
VPSVLYEYTMPSLTETTAAILRGERTAVSDTYTPPRAAHRAPSLLEERLLKPFESAGLISSVYTRCIDPLRFPEASRATVGKEEAIAGFARSLTTSKVLTAVELVARNIDVLRELDHYQAGLGTNTVRWMQHLAAEALDTITTGPSSILPEQGRLYEALSAIRQSVTAAERFAAMRRA